jgi:uncharacterized protein YqgC (DUF456 family)
VIAKEYKPDEGVYRSRDAIMHYFPMGIAATFIAIIILAAIYAKGYEGGSGALEGLRFGALIGIFINLPRQKPPRARIFMRSCRWPLLDLCATMAP